MFIKENVKLIVVLVALVGGLFLYLFQSNEKITEHDVIRQVEKSTHFEKVESALPVTKKLLINVASEIKKSSVVNKPSRNAIESEISEPFSVPLNSMADARINGDPRTPPMVRTTVEREMPTPEELADPDLYQEYESRQNQKVYRSFYSASKNKLVEMEKLMEQARSQGVSEDKLREGEEKIAKMKAMREKLAQTYDDISDEQ